MGDERVLDLILAVACTAMGVAGAIGGNWSIVGLMGLGLFGCGFRDWRRRRQERRAADDHFEESSIRRDLADGR